MIKNIIFDIGDVLVEFRWYDFLLQKGFDSETAARIGRASVSGGLWIELDRGVRSYEQVLDGFAERDPEIAEEIHRAYEDMKDIVVQREYTMDWLQELKRQGYGLYYLSNLSERLECDCSEGLSFRSDMDGGILSWQEQIVKPEQEIYVRLMERYKLKPEECVFVDDREENVESARRVGMYGVCFQNHQQTWRDLQHLLEAEG